MLRKPEVLNILKESAPGLVLLVIGVFISIAGRTSLAVLPMATSLVTFTVAGISSKTIMRKRLRRLYTHRYFDLFALLVFAVPLILFLHLGYQYAYLTTRLFLEEVSSLVVGLGIYLAIHPVLRLM